MTFFPNTCFTFPIGKMVTIVLTPNAFQAVGKAKAFGGHGGLCHFQYQIKTYAEGDSTEIAFAFPNEGQHRDPGYTGPLLDIRSVN